MTAGALDLARKRGTEHPLLTAYLRAQHVNRACGGAIVKPWEVDSLPDEWIDAAEVLVQDLPGMQAGTRQVENYLEKWRKRHRERNG